MGAVDAAAAAAAIAHSVSRRETCTSRAASLGPPLVCAARPRISATRGPWRGHGAAMRDIWPTTAVFRWTRRGAEMLDATCRVGAPRPSDATSHAMERPWTDRGRAGPRTPVDPGTRRARPRRQVQVVRSPTRTADGSGDAGPRSGKMCFGTLNSDASCTRRLVNLDPWLARRTSRAAGRPRPTHRATTEHAARAPARRPPPGAVYMNI